MAKRKSIRRKVVVPKPTKPLKGRELSQDDWRHKPKTRPAPLRSHPTPAAWDTEHTTRKVFGVPVFQTIDLILRLTIDDFDQVMRAIENVVTDSTTLSLDSKKDRDKLIQRLVFAVGGENSEESKK